MPRVAGCDPGSSSLDILVLEDGEVVDQVRFESAPLRTDPAAPIAWLQSHGPFDLIAGPSGYGLPLVRAADCTEAQLNLMSLVRPDERGQAKGVSAFSETVRRFRDAKLPVVFLPGVIHLSSVPTHRKFNHIDLGTPDKVCVAALALERIADTWTREGPFCVLELGSAFTAAIVVSEHGQIIDGVGGSSGALGWQSPGAWDGEASYLLSPLAKADLFRGGAVAIDDSDARRLAVVESLVRMVGGLCGLHEPYDQFEKIVLSGRLFATEPSFVDSLHLATALAPFARSMYEVQSIGSLEGAWVKEAAQGAAIIADGLAGGKHAELVDDLKLREAQGHVLAWLHHPRADDVRKLFA